MTELPDHLETAARRWPRKPALLGRGTALTFDQLLADVRKAADWLAHYGTGVRPVLSGPNSAELVVWLLAAMRVGVPVLASPRLPGAALSELFTHLRSTHYLGLPGVPNWSGAGLERLALPPYRDLAEPYECSPLSSDSAAPATIMLTSGSTGSPRPLQHSRGNHFYSALGSNENLPFGPGDSWLLSLPLYHVGGLGILFRCLVGGGAVVLPEGGLGLADQIAEYEITHLSLVPTQLRQIMAAEDLSMKTTSLKAILLGGAPLPEDLIEKARNFRLPVLPTYGLSEMSSQVATAPPGSPDIPQVLPYREMKIATDGEILVRGATLFQGYIENDRLALPLDSEGWFHTGDLGAIDQNGGLRFVGRKDNMFVSGGENIHPEQIEIALAAIEGVEEAVVVPVTDTEFGHRPVAFLKCSPGVSLSDAASPLTEETRFGLDHESLNGTLAAILPRFMLPRSYYPWPQNWVQSGIKPERGMFVELAEKLTRARQ